MLVSNHGIRRPIPASPGEQKRECQTLLNQSAAKGEDPPTLPGYCSNFIKELQPRSTSASTPATSESEILPLLDQWTRRVSQAGAVLGLATLICPHFRVLRAVGALSISVLSSTPVAATLLSSGTYLTYRQIPHVEQAAKRLYSGDYRNHEFNIVDDGLFLGTYGIGLLGLGVGWSSFGLGTRTLLRSRRTFFAEGYTPKKAFDGAFIHGDAVRRAVQDPDQWIQFGSSHAELLDWQRNLLIQGGRAANRLLIGGSAILGLGRFGLNGIDLVGAHQKTGHWDGGALYGVLTQLALDVGPGVTTLLYRAGRGDRGYNLGPALSQELSENIYADPHLRERVYLRIRGSVPPMRNEEEWKFINDAKADLARVDEGLRIAQTLEPLQRPSSPFTSSFPSMGDKDPILLQSKKVEFTPESRQPLDREHIVRLSIGNLDHWRNSYESGLVSPVGVLRSIQQHPGLKNSAIFPRDLRTGRLAQLLEKKAMESELHFKKGTARPLEGVFVPVKDTFPGLDGVMMVGSKTTRVRGVENSPVLKSLLEQGAIPFPVGMVAAANGGSGLNAGYGYIPHPHRLEFDPAGSSSATAHVLGLDDFPAIVGIGTDTGGSVTAPAGSVGLAGFVPPKQFLSTENMVPFDTYLDRVGVLSLHSEDALKMVRHLTHHLNGHAIKALQPREQRPAIAYVEEVLKEASPDSQSHFLEQMRKFEEAGYEIIPLGKKWNFLVETPWLLYPIDAYGAAAFTHTNPLQKNIFEPPRRSLDRNLWTRLPRGEIALRYRLFDQARELTSRYQDLVRNKFAHGAILASPSTEAVPKTEILAGRAGPLLDQHDRITMAKNRIPEWGQVNLPATQRGHVGMVLSGQLEDLVQFLN